MQPETSQGVEMGIGEREFPTRSQLRGGLLLATIGEAMRAGKGTLVSDLWWEGEHCRLADGQGTEGAITCIEDHAVGIFCDIHSPRDRWQAEHGADLRPYLAGMPAELLELAQSGALRIMCEAFPGTVTAAFWTEGDKLAAAEPWEGVVAHGAHLLDRMLKNPDDAIAEWQKHGMSSSQAAALRSLFERRLASEDPQIVVEPWEEAILLEDGAAGIEKSRALLAAVGIVLP